jgi:hypothetical protein
MRDGEPSVNFGGKFAPLSPDYSDLESCLTMLKAS